MKSASLAIALLCQLVAAVTATDFCSAKLCSGRVHIGCRNNGGFGSKCPAGRTQAISIPASLREQILDSHNRKRQQIASGQLPNFKPAERMATMQWDDELALLASYNVKTCVFGHDQCHNTDSFKYSGQNIGMLSWIGMTISDEKAMLDRIENWWSEYKDTKQSDVDKYPTSPSKVIGHFTVVTADKNTRVGCAGIRFKRDDGWTTVIFTCNYATTNVLGRPLYKSGNAASKCTSGRNPKYSALCSTSEKYDVNNI